MTLSKKQLFWGWQFGLIVLKTVGIISCSWWLVFAPLLVAIGLFVVCCFLLGAIVGLACSIDKKFNLKFEKMFKDLSEEIGK